MLRRGVLRVHSSHAADSHAGMCTFCPAGVRRCLAAHNPAWHGVQTRVALSKDERKALKAKQRAGLSGSALVSDFADDAVGVLDVDAGEAPFFDKVRLGQKFGSRLAIDGATLASAGAFHCCATHLHVVEDARACHMCRPTSPVHSGDGALPACCICGPQTAGGEG